MMMTTARTAMAVIPASPTDERRTGSLRGTGGRDPLTDQWKCDAGSRLLGQLAAAIRDADLLARHDIAIEGERCGVVDIDLHRLAGQARVAVEDHDVIGACAARELHRAAGPPHPRPL